MDCREGSTKPYGFYPNGLLPSEVASVTRVLQPERWTQAEERTAELIAYIQPNQSSVKHRNAIASYVKCLIMKCFPCQVFTLGSVPLRTYLPDGDIDLTAFSNNQNLKDNWANEVRELLESEEKNEHAEFRLKEVQYINAEVKIIKCLIENIVVDISINQLGGLCTLCFLEEVDNFINHNHLFKRSIILIKAWCYYESRILGAHHGLISTYALETLVLYIFHVFNNSFAGPLEVLYRFLEFFSKFDWDNFCVSLWGPVPISSLPNMAADPPRNDGEELSLSKLLYSCLSAYTVLPNCQDYQEHPFVPKHFNIVDPLRMNNNLGRSVSKGNFFRIRSAFAFGARRLARLLDCPKENLIAELNQFFMNTWKRHGKGHRPDTPCPVLYDQKSGDLNKLDKYESFRNFLSGSRNEVTEKFTNHESETAVNPASHAPLGVFSQHGKHSLIQMSRSGYVSAVCYTESQKGYGNTADSVMSNKKRGDLQNFSSKDNKDADKGRNSRPVSLNNEVHVRSQFARTDSSPELICTSSEVPHGGKSSSVSDSGNNQTAPTKSVIGRRNICPKFLDSHSANFLTDNKQTSSQSFSQLSLDAAVNPNDDSNSHYGVSSLGSVGNDRHTVGETMQLNQEQQDFMNLMASRCYSFNGQVQMLVNLTSANPPLPTVPPVLASMGYAQRNLTGTTPTSIPVLDSPQVSNMHHSQGLFPLPVSQYHPGIGLTSNREELTIPVDSSLISTESNQGEHERQNVHSLEGYCHSHISFQAQKLQDKKIPAGSKSFGVKSSDSYSLKDQRLVENKDLTGQRYADNSPRERTGEGDVNSAASSRFLSPQAIPSVTKSSSENYWEGFSFRPSKSKQDKHERKSVSSADLSTTEGLAKNRFKYKGESVDSVSSQAYEDRRAWIPLSTVSDDVAERLVSGSVASSDVQTHSIPGYEPAPVSGSNSVLPVASVLLGSESQHMTRKNQGLFPFTFYPCSAVPFLTMLPVYNVPTGTGTSSVSTNHFDGDEFDNCQSGQSDHSLDSRENLDQLQAVDTQNSKKHFDSGEQPEHYKTDILDGDFVSHLQNLQYGRFCQSAGIYGPLLYTSPVVLPPMYSQGHIMEDSPGRSAAHIGLFRHFMGCGPHLTSVSQLLSGFSQPLGVYEHWGNEIPWYHIGCGTYMSNPSNSSHGRQSSNISNQKGSYGYNRKNHVGKREGNWNTNSKPRFTGRGRGHNRAEKPNRRIDMSTSNNSRSQKNDYPPSYDTQNCSFDITNSINHSSANVASFMHPLPVVNPTPVSHSRSTIPSLVMLRPRDQNMGYCSANQPEFGSLGAVSFSGMDEVSHFDQGSSRGC